VKKNHVWEAMEARSVDAIPAGEMWQYEPKWDGFRCLLARDDQAVAMYSKSGQNLSRYFPEVVAAALTIREKSFVLDGEIVVRLVADFRSTAYPSGCEPGKEIGGANSGSVSRVRSAANVAPA
jgi:hypothetical protein